MNIRERVEAWQHNTDRARVAVPLGELRAAVAEMDSLYMALVGMVELAKAIGRDSGGCYEQALAALIKAEGG